LNREASRLGDVGPEGPFQALRLELGGRNRPKSFNKSTQGLAATQQLLKTVNRSFCRENHIKIIKVAMRSMHGVRELHAG